MVMNLKKRLSSHVECFSKALFTLSRYRIIEVDEKGLGQILVNHSRSHVERFPKTLFPLSWYRIAEDDDSGDLLSRWKMHTDDRDEIALVAQ
jgi:hypothetical protein